MSTTPFIIRALEKDETASSLIGDLFLERLFVLRSPRKWSLNTIAFSSPMRGCLENSPTDAERHLRISAEAGNPYAMHRLGSRLLHGNGVPKSIEEGVLWLKRSAGLGNPFAMERLADYYFDASQPGTSADGEHWLRRAVEHGYQLAKANLATRLITGIGMAPDASEGQRLLRECAQKSSELGMLKLAICLLDDHRADRNEEGRHWLRLTGITRPEELLELGSYLYESGLNMAGTRSDIAAKEASILFEEALRQGVRVAALNLAYLLRRGEIPSASHSLDQLLLEHLENKHPLAIVNQALRLARGVQCERDWKAADDLIRQLPYRAEIFTWWSGRSAQGDAEGHLVLGWLVRHLLAKDPAGLSLARRIELARMGGWIIPEWMNHQAAGDRNS